MKKSPFLFFTVFALALGSHASLGMRPSPPAYTPEKHVDLMYTDTRNIDLSATRFKKALLKMSADVLLNVFYYLIYDGESSQPYFIPALEATMTEIDKRGPRMLLLPHGEPYITDEWSKPKHLMSRIVYMSCARSHYEIAAFFVTKVPWFIQHGVPVDTKYVDSMTRNETTPLMNAIRYPLPTMVEVLLKNKADQHISLHTQSGSTTPRAYAQAQAAHNNEYQQIINILNRYDTQAPVPVIPSVTTHSSSSSTKPLSPITATISASPEQMPHVSSSPAPVPTTPNTANSTTSTTTASIASTPSSANEPLVTEQANINKPTPASTLPSLRWRATDNKIIAAVASVIFATALYRWLTDRRQATDDYTKNVLINKTGSNIFVRGSDTPIVPDQTLPLPENGILFITLDKNGDLSQDLKINTADYTQDTQNSYLNLSIHKKWLSKWFPKWVTVPLISSKHLIKKE